LNNRRTKFRCFVVVFFIFLLAFQFFPLDLINESKEINDQRNSPLSADVIHTKQWIKNGNFTSQEFWNSSKGELGDPEDVDSTISGGYANYSVLGDDGEFSLIADPPISSDWRDTYNPDYPAFPDNHGIDDQKGMWLEHEFTESPLSSDQMASVNWERNATMPVNMSDYIITSASLNAVFNASVDENIEIPGDQADYFTTYDWAKFYVMISNANNVSYIVAEYQMDDVGEDGQGNPQTKTDTSMNTVPEESLIIYLTSILSYDYVNFNITMGILVWCEDNRQIEYDHWLNLTINKLNLTFSYEKKINQLTSVSWNQVGDKPSDISNNTITVNEVLLGFKYKINDTWPTLSPNSEIRILINDIQHSETVKLINATISIQDAKSGGFDVTSLISENANINLSLQVYIADDFKLNRIITISIDEVYLNITYTESTIDKPTNLQLLLNNENKTGDPVIILPLGVNLNITIQFTNQTGGHIPGAVVQLEGKVNSLLSENLTLQQYSTIINTSDVGIGVRILTVIAQKNLFETQNFPFFIEITERDTELQLFLNEIPKNDSDSIQLEIDESINVTVKYKDSISTNHLSNATVNLLGIGVLNETNNQYTISINESDLGQGITVLTIFAQLIDYQSQSIQFFVEVIERNTKILLFVDGVPKNDGDTVQVELDESLNVTIYYRDNQTDAHLNNASVLLVGRGILDEIGNQYNISINAQDLDQGITVLTIFGQLINYQSQSIQFFVEVIERSTELDLFLNNEDKTLDPVYSLTKGQSLNLTIKYTDNQTGQHINTGIVQLIGEGLLLNLTRDNILGQYYIILDTTTLGIGVKLFTIVAHATNYQIRTVDPRITVNRISVTINTENGASQIEVDVGGNVLLQIVLNDTIFGGIIVNATVTYRWAYGQGELVDPDDDNIYETTLLNVQSGVYAITITAFAGDDYDFESFEITLIVSQPTTQPGTDLSWLVFVLIGAILGLVTIFIFYQTYFKYPPLVRKIRKIKKSVKKGRKTKPILVSKREEILKNNFKDHKKLLGLELDQPEILDKINKNSIKKEEEM